MKVKPKRWRGQHFLADQNMLKKIVAAASLDAGDTAVEIGAGTGNLTVLLAQNVKRVIAIEIDRDLIPMLRERCGRYHNVEIIRDDARKFNPTNYNLRATSYRVVANIPYNITSLLVRRLLEAETPPRTMTLLVQKEVAKRMCAQPPHMSLLSVAVQYYAVPRILFFVPRTCFSPRPRVDSAVVSFSLREGGGAGAQTRGDESARFFRVVHAGFAHKRKLLASNLSDALGISRKQIIALFEAIPLDANARAQELTLAQWKDLARLVHPLPEKRKKRYTSCI